MEYKAPATYTPTDLNFCDLGNLNEARLNLNKLLCDSIVYCGAFNRLNMYDSPIALLVYHRPSQSLTDVGMDTPKPREFTFDRGLVHVLIFLYR